MITNNPFKCIDLPYSEIFNSFVLKAFANHNSNAAQIIGFGIHKLKYCGMRRKYWFPAILYKLHNSTLTLKAFIGFVDISEGLCLNIIWFYLFGKRTIFLCMNVLYLLLHWFYPYHPVKTNWSNPSPFPNL